MMLLSALALMAGQAATEAVKQGVNPTWPAVGLAAVAAMGSWLSVIFGNRQRSQNKETLDEHAKKLEAHDTEIKNICKRMDEIRADNKTDHTKIFDRMDAMKDQIIEVVRSGK